MKEVDRTLSVLLILGGVGHSLGSYKAYHSDQMELLWALCASLFVFLLGTINLLRASRPSDGALAWICFGALIAWIPSAIRFGQLAGNLLDFRVVIFVALSLALCGFSLRTIRTARP